MGDYFYHSALKWGEKHLQEVEPLDRGDHGGCVALQNDLVTSGLPEAMDDCDVIYGECPWPEGFKKFDDMADVERRPYALFQKAVLDMILTTPKPIYMILGKTLLKPLPKPAGFQPTKLNGGDVHIAWWNDSYRGPLGSNVQITEHLGSRYKRMGDFCCGYGEPLFQFLAGGGESFVGADHNGKCIRVLYEQMQQRLT